ncbi:glycosyltransferase family 2 protein [Arenibaculum pallidiluteum]|uniref:glycosyltransferase family 2 protein n=1 Tax=Arenibaculum pallidiluteum TaxID=2812559 RepID=UPI001A956F62|nr:glycosyltransferase family A protein [Arenibaculum pallidiluteum]
MADLVSVIIPTYNRADTLTRAVDSALNQTHRAVEAIVVDDGSTDATAAVMERRYGAEPRVRFMRQDNAGAPAARNRAMRAASGDYLAFLDSDDVWKPWKLELQLACFRAFPEAGMVWTDMEAIDPAGRAWDPRHLRTMYADSYRWFTREQLFPKRATLGGGPWDAAGPAEAWCGEIYSPMIMGNLVHTPTVLLRRDRFEKVGFFDEGLKVAGEDYEYHLRTTREGPVAYVDLPTIEYQTGVPGAISHRSRAMAAAFLGTLTRTLGRDRHRIDLPPWMLREVFRRAHAWNAEEAVAAGDIAEARRHYLKSLAHGPWQPRAYAQLALCAMPPGIADTLRGVWHRMKPGRTAQPHGA